MRSYVKNLVNKVSSGQTKSLLRYLIAGSSAFITEYGSFYVLFSALSLQLYVANSLSFSFGLLVSFSLNRMWAFNGGTYKRSGHHQFAIYFCLAAVNLLITNVLIGLLRHRGVDPLLGKVICMAMIICWNFFIYKRVIFSQAI
jgi:putative flippase GtrA